MVAASLSLTLTFSRMGLTSSDVIFPISTRLAIVNSNWSLEKMIAMISWIYGHYKSNKAKQLTFLVQSQHICRPRDYYFDVVDPVSPKNHSTSCNLVLAAAIGKVAALIPASW